MPEKVPQKGAGRLVPLMLPLLLFCLPLFAGESGWNTVWAPHFIIHQETGGPRRAVSADFEKVFRVLRGELWSLSSWMDTEKVEVYLYKDRDGYLKGKFKPADWSAGMVRSSGRPGSSWVLAVYEPLSTQVFAHELTHLYFRSFFNNSAGRIPPWLDEGLAEMISGEAAGIPPGRVVRAIPAAEFFKAKKVPDSAYGDFYPQAESVVLFLKKGKRMKFEKFCRQLRDGEQVERALSSAYGFRTFEDLEKAWKKWSGLPEKKKPGKPKANGSTGK